MLQVDIERFLFKFVRDKRAVWACIALVVLLVLFTSAELYEAIVDNDIDLAQEVSQADIRKIDKNYQIAKWHLFGTYTPPAKRKVVKRRVKLKLEAIFFSRSGKEKSGALISEAGKPAKFFYQGEKLSNGALIKTINPDGIIVDYGDSEENVKLPIPELKFAPPPKNTFVK